LVAEVHLSVCELTTFPTIAEQSGLYIDVENLQSDARNLIDSLMRNWPPEVPSPTHMVLYVRADMVELWKTWALSRFDVQNVDVKGIQHFASMKQSKNSGDIAIAVDAMSDLLKGRVSHVAVFSDDSDFISLFAKVRDETGDIRSRLGRIPFIWILTERDGTRSATIGDFFPASYLHFVQGTTTTSQRQSHASPAAQRSAPVIAPAPDSTAQRSAPVTAPAPDSTLQKSAPVTAPAPDSTLQKSAPVTAPAPDSTLQKSAPITAPAPDSTLQKSAPVDNHIPASEEESIAAAIIRERPLGTFKSTDCKSIIKQGFPNHSLASMDNARFGSQFAEKIWPLLEEKGGKQVKGRPIRYEMTQVAKDSLAP
jgi:hypothetical protein